MTQLIFDLGSDKQNKAAEAPCRFCGEAGSSPCGCWQAHRERWETKTKSIHCEMFKHYGGDLDRTDFGILVCLMNVELSDAYICGMGDRQVAWNKFVDGIKFKLKCTPRRAGQEARLVFDAVDNVHAFS